MKISVLIITYNQENLISKAIDSILNQTIIPEEIIISDDNSNDNSLMVMEKYQDMYPHLIRIHQTPKNLGIAGNIKFGASHCKEDVITLLSGDDYLRCTAIELIKKNTPTNINLNNLLVVSNVVTEYKGEFFHNKKTKININNIKSKTIRKKHEFLKIAISKNLLLDADYPEKSIGIWADWCFDYNISKQVQEVIKLKEYLYVYRNNIGVSSSTGEFDMDQSNIRAINYIIEREINFKLREKLFLLYQKKLSISRAEQTIMDRIELLFLFLITITDSYKFHRYTISKIVK